MKVLIVYCHPSKSSFTYQVKEKFVEGLKASGNDILISDLYDMDFQTDMSEAEYLRETYYRKEDAVPSDVRQEQNKIEWADAICFIYPVFWTEAPAKLVGWFDRVWTSGYAYSPEPTMKRLEKALFIACAGKSIQSFQETGEGKAMETVMLGDRIRDRAKEKRMVILDGVTHWDEKYRTKCVERHLIQAYQLGKTFGEE